MIATLEDVVRILDAKGVQFIVIDGWAAIVHGVARSTNDVDVVYSRDAKNIACVAEAMKDIHPYPRGAPKGLPFRWNAKTIRAGLNFTLTTDRGDIDLLAEVPGGGTYDLLLPNSRQFTALGITCRVVSLEKLIELKRAAGRPKDFETISELQVLLQERGNG